MPRKSRKKAPAESSATEPVPVFEVLQQSPIAAILADPKSGLVTADQLPPAEQGEALAAFQRQREREQAVEEPRHAEKVGRVPAKPTLEDTVTEALVESQAPSHVQRLTGLRPTPSGFVGLESFRNAGIRLSRSLDKTIVAIQFADDWRPSRDGLNSEKQHLDDRGFIYRPERAQWERNDREWPADNYQDAKAFVASLVKERLVGIDVGRS